MAPSDERELYARFQTFLTHTLRAQPSIIEREHGRFFDRIEGDPKARIERDDFAEAASPGATTHALERQWSVWQFGRGLAHRYYLVTTVALGNIEAQEVTYAMYEYRFAGPRKFHQWPQWRHRKLPPISVTEIGLYYESAIAQYSDAIDHGWTGREHRVEPVAVLTSFGRLLQF